MRGEENLLRRVLGLGSIAKQRTADSHYLTVMPPIQRVGSRLNRLDVQLLLCSSHPDSPVSTVGKVRRIQNFGGGTGVQSRPPFVVCTSVEPCRVEKIAQPCVGELKSTSTIAGSTGA